MKDKISKLINNGSLNDLKIFGDLLLNNNIKKKYSILKNNKPYPLGNNLYKLTFCFFFYSREYLIETFYCEIDGEGIGLNNERINFYRYPCNDVNRADCWEWVNVA